VSDNEDSPPIPNMARCIGTCKDGTQCAFKSKKGFTACGRHLDQGEEVEVRVCGWENSEGHICQRPSAEGKPHCRLHMSVLWGREVKQLRLAARRVWTRVLEILWGEMDPTLARNHLAEAIAGAEDNPFMPTYIVMLEEEIAFFHHMNQERQDAAPRGELEALARDRQNVHTVAVTQQTRSGLEILLWTFPTAGQDTLLEIEQVWEQSHTRSIRMVLADMRQWYNVATCRTEDDWLYKRTLDGLWSYIKQSPAREELTERLWEECYESVRMCCDGHISRLCNVLCGFVEDFKPPVSAGELLQQKMAVIAEKEIPVEDKVGEAWAVFEELGTPMDQREAWIDAF
jgi:hypothetical protein